MDCSDYCMFNHQNLQARAGPVMDIDHTTGDVPEINRALESLRLSAANTAEASQAVNVLADASKEPSTRKQLADPTILRNLVQITETIDYSISESLETTHLALRCLGNAAIDNNAVRKVLTEIGFSWAVRCLQLSGTDYETQLLTTKVLYNICCDYEAAQQQCLKEHVHHALICFYINQAFRPNQPKLLFVELLFWICSHKEPESTVDDPLSGPVLTYLLHLYQHYKNSACEDWAMLLETCLLFLRDTAVQSDIVLTRQMQLVLGMLQTNEHRIAGADDEEDRKLLISLSASLIWCLSDMAARPQFSQTYDMRNRTMNVTVMRAIIAVANLGRIPPDTHPDFGVMYTSDTGLGPRIATAACQILGNYLWALTDPQAFAYLVETERLHMYALHILSSSPDSELLHSAAGLLIQLTRPAQVREIIATDGQARFALERLCRHENPLLKQDGIRLLRSLGRDCPANQERFSDLASEVMSSSSSDNTGMIEAPS